MPAPIHHIGDWGCRRMGRLYPPVSGSMWSPTALRNPRRYFTVTSTVGTSFVVRDRSFSFVIIVFSSLSCFLHCADREFRRHFDRAWPSCLFLTCQLFRLCGLPFSAVT
jgi:hypothetical protein